MSLISHYPLNGDATDYFGNATAVNGSSGISYIDGKIGRAISFDNSSPGYLSAPEISNYLHGKPEASIALWVKKSAVQYGFLQLSGYASGNGNLYPYKTATKVYLDVFRTNRLGPIYMPTSVLEWHHLVITQKPGQWKLYQNGVLVNTSGANATVSTDYLQFEIGRNSGSRYAFGDFDDVRIYDHALSEKEVSDLAKGLVASYNFDGDIIDIFGSDSESVYNASFVDTIKGKAAFFNGTSDYIRKNENLYLGTNHRTVSCWIMKTSAGDNYNCAMHRGTNDSVGASDIFLGVTAANKLIASLGENNWPAAETNITCVNDVWYFLAVTWNGSLGSVYVNGVLENTYTLTSFPSRDTFPLRFGASSDGSQYQFGGLVTGAKIHTTALSSDQIYKEYVTGLSVDNIGNMHTKYLDESPKVRYIRDYLNGSTSNGGSHWVEIQANDTDGVNVALNASAYDAAGNSEPLLTDGNTNTNPYARASGNYMEVDLGGVFLLDNIHVWHYYYDGRTYYGTKTEVSVDGQNWTTIFDNAVDGLYPETSSGKVHRIIPPSNFSVNYSGVSVGEASEVGVSRGLVSWLPLIGDTKDRVTNEVATNNGATPVGDGYEFDGSGEIDGSPTGSYIAIPEAITNTSTNNYPQGCTYSVWLNVDTDAVDRMGLFWGSSTIRHIEIYSISKNFRTEAATQNGYSFGSGNFPDDVRGVWSNFTIVFANGEAGRPVRWYQNGKLFHTGSMAGGSNSAAEYFSFSGLGRATGSGRYTYGKSFDGKIRGFRIYENTLTPEEVAQEYNSGKASLNKNSAFAKEFIEV